MDKRAENQATNAENKPGLNLVLPIGECSTTMAQTVIDQLCATDDISGVLAKVGAGCEQVRVGTGRHLALFYTDFQPDDLQAIAQLWQWKLEG